MADEVNQTDQAEAVTLEDQAVAAQDTKAVVAVARAVAAATQTHLEHTPILTEVVLAEHQDRAVAAEMVTTDGQDLQGPVAQEQHLAYPDLQSQEAVAAAVADTARITPRMVHRDPAVAAMVQIVILEQLTQAAAAEATIQMVQAHQGVRE